MLIAVFNDAVDLLSDILTGASTNTTSFASLLPFYIRGPRGHLELNSKKQTRRAEVRGWLIIISASSLSQMIH